MRLLQTLLIGWNGERRGDIHHSTSLLEIVLLSGRVIDDNCRWVGFECGCWWKRKKGRGWCWSRLGGNDIVGRRIVGQLAKCFLIAKTLNSSFSFDFSSGFVPGLIFQNPPAQYSASFFAELDVVAVPGAPRNASLQSFFHRQFFFHIPIPFIFSHLGQQSPKLSAPVAA